MREAGSVLVLCILVGVLFFSACAGVLEGQPVRSVDRIDGSISVDGSGDIDGIVERQARLIENSGGRDRKLGVDQPGDCHVFDREDQTTQLPEELPRKSPEEFPEEFPGDLPEELPGILPGEQQPENLPEPEPKAEPEAPPVTEPTQTMVPLYAQLSDEAIRALDNKKVGWGAKHNGHEQPEIPKATRDLFDRNNTIFMGNPDKQVIYLTFDAGYENGYTESILDTLEEHNVRAAFFITGHYLATNPQIVRRMLEEQHIVGNHTDKHTSLPDDTDEKIRKELSDLSAAFARETGEEMLYFRPPMGEYSERTLALTAKMGYRTVLWSFAYVDYDETQAQGETYAYHKIVDNLHPGGIFLLHTESKENTAVLGRVIRSAREMGFEFQSLKDFH